MLHRERHSFRTRCARGPNTKASAKSGALLPTEGTGVYVFIHTHLYIDTVYLCSYCMCICMYVYTYAYKNTYFSVYILCVHVETPEAAGDGGQRTLVICSSPPLGVLLTRLFVLIRTLVASHAVPSHSCIYTYPTAEFQEEHHALQETGPASWI